MKKSPEPAQHHPLASRLTAVEPNPRTFRSLAVVLTRIVAMIAIAGLLILVLLPAALAVQANSG
jgi:hypothetical protein